MSDFVVKDVSVDLRDLRKQADKIAKNNEVGYYFASTFYRFYKWYVPRRTGALMQNIYFEPFAINHNMQYASYVYENDKNYIKDINKKATYHWAEKCFDEQGADIIKDLENYIRRKR